MIFEIITYLTIMSYELQKRLLAINVKEEKWVAEQI